MPAAGAPDEWHLPGVFDGAGAYLAELDDVGDHQTPIIRIHINHEMNPASISEVNIDKEKLKEAIVNMQLGGDIGDAKIL